MAERQRTEPYASGRVAHQGASSCVVEEGTIYASPAALARMAESERTAPGGADRETVLISALRAAGMQSWQIETVVGWRGRVQLVADHELVDYPVRNIGPETEYRPENRRSYLNSHASPGRTGSPGSHRGGRS